MHTLKDNHGSFSTLSKVVITAVIFLLVFGSGLAVNKAKAQTVNYQPQTADQYLAFLFGQLLQLQVQLASLQEADSGRESLADLANKRYNNPFYMQILSMAPSAVGRNTAELQGRADIGSSEFGRLWFEYGQGTSLNKRSDRVNIEHARENVYKIKVTELSPDTKYSYRAVVEDEDGNALRGLTRTFTTVEKATTQYFVGKPVVESEGVENVLSTSASVKVFVSMNDFVDGRAFAVYSNKRSDLSDIEDDYETYDEIEASSWGNDKNLRKTTFGRNTLTERSTITGRLSNLTRASEQYYKVCVEYSDDRDNLNFVCSGTESFVTTN